MYRKIEDAIKSLNKGVQTNSEQFWEMLEGPDSLVNSHKFSSALYELIVLGQKKPIVQANYDRILATLLSVSYFKKSGKKRIVSEEEKKVLKDSKFEIYGNGSLILHIFLKQVQSQSLVEHLLSRYVFLPQINEWKNEPGIQIKDKIRSSQAIIRQSYFFSSPKAYSCLKYLSFPPFQSLHMLRLTFSYLCIHEQFKENHNHILASTYEYILEGFKGYVHALRSTHQASMYMQLLMHLLEQFIKLYGCQQEKTLKQFFKWLCQIRNNTGMVGEKGRKLFLFIHEELKAPGQSFRKKICQDFPNILEQKAQFLQGEVYLVGNCEELFGSPPSYSLINIRKLMIFHAFRACHLTDCQFYLPAIAALDESQTYNIFTKISKIIEAILTLEKYQTIKSIQKEALTQIMQSLPQNKHYNLKQYEEFKKLTSDQNALGIFPYPRLEIIHILSSNFIHPKARDNFYHLLKKKKSLSNKFKHPLKLVFYGQDIEFREILTILVQYMEKTSAKELQKLKIYVVPKANLSFHVAHYLSHVDIWYKRIVYQPFHNQIFFPHLEPSFRTRCLLPHKLLSDTMQVYLREAEVTYPIRVYKCLLKRKDNSQETTYFYSHVGVGSSAQVQLLRQTKKQDKQKYKKYVNMDYIELLTQKVKKVQPTYAKLEMVELCPVTKNISEVEEKNIKFQDMMICNLPCEYFMGNQPQPSKPELQISMLTPSSAQTFRKEVLNSKNFKSEELSSEMIQSFRDLFINFTILKITIEALKDTLTLLIDGQSFSNIAKVEIEPVERQNGLPVTLPIQTFLDV